jgi:uncharacterized protein with NAD-binding domain and iron-sulfur cluster
MNEKILIIGGGIAGLTTSMILEAAPGKTDDHFRPREEKLADEVFCF